jgi:hypothetical protein
MPVLDDAVGGSFKEALYGLRAGADRRDLVFDPEGSRVKRGLSPPSGC